MESHSDSSKSRPYLELKFIRSLSSPRDHTPSNLSVGPHDIDSRSEVSQRLYHTRLSGLSQRWILSFLLCLGLLLAWVIGHYQASPVLLVLLGVAALYVGCGRWQGVVKGAWLEAELQMRRKLRTQLRGESAEWLNFVLNRWWTTCSKSVLSFSKNYVEPLIVDLLPPGVDFVEVVDIDLGEETPVLSNMRLLDPPTSTRGVASSSSATCTMVALFDLTVPSPNSRIILRARVGGKSIGSNHLVYVESLYISGTVQAVILLDHKVSFPHVVKITASFINKPDIWFSVKVLKGLRVTGIPLLKTLIHSIVMDMFTTLLVDPGKLTLNFDPSPLPDDDTGCRQAEGVITVSITGTYSPKGKEKKSDARSWLSLSLGDKKYRYQLQKGVWQVTYSFLVYDLKQDVLVVKVKQLHVVYNKTLAVHTVSLDSLGFMNEGGEEGQGNRSLSLSNHEGGGDLKVSLSYDPLPSFSVRALNGFPQILENELCGVLYVHVHGGEGLLACDSDGLSDPYCIVHANKQKILQTHYVPDTLNPLWDKGVEVFVSDITQVVLTFIVLDWDGPLVGDDLMGTAKLTFNDECSEHIHRKLSLLVDTNQSFDLGEISISALFRPVSSVGRASSQCHVTSMGTGEHKAQDYVGVAISDGGPRKLSKFLKNRKQYYKREGYLMEHGVLEVKVICGRDLVAKDSNGLSDPYVVIKYGSHVMFRTKIIRKTLNPEWNETVTLAAPAPDDIVHVECWDKDIIFDDFMGSIQFTDSDLQKFTNCHWCKLDHVKHGDILLDISLSQEETDDPQLRLSDEIPTSRHITNEVPLLENRHVRGSIVMKSSPSTNSLCSSSSISVHSTTNQPDDSSDAAVSQTSSTLGVAHQSSIKSATHLISSPNHTHTPPSSTPNDGTAVSYLKRRHTLSHHSRPLTETSSYERTTDPSHLPRYSETTADIEWALKRGGEVGGAKTSTIDRSSHKEKQITVYHNVSGQVVEATGLKGELDHMALYIKVRLNTRPSYQRQHKFGRGPVVHKTRLLRGSQSPQWREDFMVKESSVPSDSLLTLDLKSGSKVNIGTYAITLDKFFDGSLKMTRSFDIGNDVKLRVKLSRQLH